MSDTGAAPRAAVPISSARAEASRQNGARSRGPKTPEGKARSSRNPLKHGLRAQKHVVLPVEDATEFQALEAAMTLELAPVGALQTALARRVAVAAWRLDRADRIETELFAYRCRDDGNLAIGLMRDGNGTRSIETLLRYRGAAQAELTRALRTLKALQAEQAAKMPAGASAAEPRRRRAGLRAIERTPPAAVAAAPGAPPNKPEARPGPAAAARSSGSELEPRPSAPAHLPPNEPESRRKPRNPARTDVRSPVPPTRNVRPAAPPAREAAASPGRSRAAP
jgi:hypothetical protein